MLLGAMNGSGTLDPSVGKMNPQERGAYLSASPYLGVGSYGVNKLKNGTLEDIRMLLALQSSKQGDNVVFHALIFFPSMIRNKNYVRRGDRLSVLRGEYTTNNYGVPVFRIKLRYIGPYSNDVGILSPDMPEVAKESDQEALVTAALQKIIDKGDDYWNDDLRKRDDITRDLPL